MARHPVNTVGGEASDSCLAGHGHGTPPLQQGNQRAGGPYSPQVTPGAGGAVTSPRGTLAGKAAIYRHYGSAREPNCTPNASDGGDLR